MGSKNTSIQRNYNTVVTAKRSGKLCTEAISAIIRIFESLKSKYPGLIVITGVTPDLASESSLTVQKKVAAAQKKSDSRAIFFISAIAESERYFALAVISYFLKDTAEITREISGIPMSVTGAPVTVMSKYKDPFEAIDDASVLLYSDKEVRTSTDAETAITFIHRERGLETPITIELYKSPLLKSTFKGTKELYIIVTSTDISGSKKRVTLPATLSPAKIITANRLVPKPMTRYVDKVNTLGILRGTVGKKNLEKDVSLLFSAVHEIIAGGTLDSQSIKFSSDGNKVVKANLDKLLAELIKEINGIELKGQGICWFL
jgi:hypothetical protein